MVPIRSMGPAHRERIALHLLALSDHDRYLRFGYLASDEQIRRYTDHIDFDRDDIFGIYNRKLQLLAVAHLAFSDSEGCKGCAEFGVSVLAMARGKGYGSRLFERAEIHARNEGVRMLFIHALSENTAMIRIAKRNGATLERQGSETEAHLLLAPATVESRVDEFLDERIAQFDFEMKLQAKQFWDFLASVQAIRQAFRPTEASQPPNPPAQ